MKLKARTEDIKAFVGSSHTPVEINRKKKELNAELTLLFSSHTSIKIGRASCRERVCQSV